MYDYNTKVRVNYVKRLKYSLKNVKYDILPIKIYLNDQLNKIKKGGNQPPFIINPNY